MKATGAVLLNFFYLLCLCLVTDCQSATDSLSDYGKATSFVDIPAERTSLINGVVSYQSIEEVRQLLGEKASSWEVIENSKLGSGDRRPPFAIYTVSVKGYSDLDFTGELQLQFFNNRLLRTLFFPAESDKYMDVLVSKQKVLFSNRQDARRETNILPHTRVWTAVDYKNRRYIAWEDIRLSKEMDIWIQQYS